MNRRKKLYLNTITALLLQIVTFICGFILPKQILLYFGSDVNGLVSSISRFLSVITFLEMGISPVIQSNLYKPLAENDVETMSKVVCSSEKFYKRIAYIFIVYIAALFFIYPSINNEFDFWFTGSLIIILSITTFAQYYFGLTYQVFLNADQKIYISSFLQIFTVIFNTIISVILIKLGCSVHVVKLVSSCVYVIKPLALNIYVKRHYALIPHIKYTEEPIKQKWNGFAQHIAAVVCGEIDVMLLTFLANYQSVSIYSVYFMVVNGITMIVMNMVSGLEAFWGNMIANNERENLLKTFDWVECLMHAAVTFLYGATAVLIAPFISVYIKGATDASAYYLPVFGLILTLAYGAQCLRVPYFRVIKASGHYKQTQMGSFISMLINIIVSVALVLRYGLIGVSLGTLAAMLYHTIYFANYLKKNILNRPIRYFIKHFAVDMVAGTVILMICRLFTMHELTYISWVVYAVKVSMISAIVVFGMNLTLYHKQFGTMFARFIKK